MKVLTVSSLIKDNPEKDIIKVYDPDITFTYDLPFGKLHKNQQYYIREKFKILYLDPYTE